MNNFRPYIAVLCAAIVFGSSGAFVKHLQLSPVTLGFIRTFIPALFVGVYCFSRNRLRIKPNFRIILLGSALNAVRLAFYFHGFSNSDISTAMIVLYTWPVFTAVNAGIFLGEKTPYYQYVLLVLAITGIVIINLDGNACSLLQGEMFGLLAVLFSILYSLHICS
jgi:drug/metabolite transporter (DMT)-like permease